MPAAAPILTGLLKEVSRSFYLTLRILPAPVRAQVGVAYLLARATDTIADTEVLAASERIKTLEMLRQRIDNTQPVRLDLSALCSSQSSTAEATLLRRVEEVLDTVSQFSPADQDRIRQVLRTITSGQILDLERFGVGAVRALRNAEELDDYTYRVAGCVGEFWTVISQAHLFPAAQLDTEGLIHNGVRFGQGLQLVNILRDVASDLRTGRCYFPEDELARAGLRPQDLLEPAAMNRFETVYRVWWLKARSHLEAGWRYTNTLPRRCVRLRLACAWPILIGTRTLNRLEQANVLDPTRRVKVSRGEVRRVIFSSIVRYPCRAAWQRQITLPGPQPRKVSSAPPAGLRSAK